MQLIQQLQKIRQNKMEQAKLDEADRDSGSSAVMNSKTMKFKM